VIYIDEADLILTGSKDYEWFGFDSVCGAINGDENERAIFVGAPGTRVD
jgi:hypothetical protein